MSQGVYRTDNAAGKELREDLMDVINDLSPVMTPLFTGLQKSTANQSIHEWVVDSTARSTSVSAQAEGLDVTYSDLTAPSRATNYVQEITQPFKVSVKEIDSVNVGGDPYARYRVKAMKQWKLKAEYALIWGTGNSGASGTGWEMKGLKKAITTNYVSYASGTTLTETRLNDILELMYGDVDDDTLELYTSIGLKRVISSFTSGSTKYIESKDKRLVNSVDIYESDVAAMVKLFAHRDIPNPSASNGWLMAIQPKAFAVSFLHQPEERRGADNGPYQSGYIYGSLTLEYRYEKAAARGENLS